MRTSQKITGIVTTIGIDIGKNTFHLVGFEQRGAIILQQKVSRNQLERRVANIPRCLIGMEAGRRGPDRCDGFPLHPRPAPSGREIAVKM
jgi:hypothetical protein